MAKKIKKGYYVKGHFVAEGSELDQELKIELKGTDSLSKTDRKRESSERQDLGEALLTLRQDLLTRLIQDEHLNEQLIDALEEAKKITNFEGKRRQLQFIGKLMRKLSEEDIDALRACLEEQQSGSTKETHMLHLIEAWRDRLMTQDEALEELLHAHPTLDLQQLRALIRQARRDNKTQPSDLSKGLAPRQSKAYRELFQFLKELLLSPEQATLGDTFDSAQESQS
jgi:ribosome-associated protein